MWRMIVFLVLLVCGGPVGGAWAGSSPEVHIVYFSSPHCPFCTVVSERDLEPLSNQYGETLHIVRVDTSMPEGRSIFEAFWEASNVPPSRRGVPTVVIGKHVLVGAGEIPDRLPALVASSLAAGGVDLPALPGLAAYDLTTDGTAAPSTWRDRIHHDVPGNYVALAQLSGMSLLGLVMLLGHRRLTPLTAMIPMAVKVGVATVGLGAAVYLSWGETTQQDLVCGPIGQCNVVQHSDMAMLWGLFPVAILGVLGYLVVLTLYGLAAWGPRGWEQVVQTMLLVVAGFGFVFSLLLTFWQPFMIGATCMWCLVSALSMTFTCLFAVGTARVGSPQTDAVA